MDNEYIYGKNDLFSVVIMMKSMIKKDEFDLFEKEISDLIDELDNKLKSISDNRKREVRTSFLRLADYAKENSIPVVLLSGDVFDSDTPSRKDKKFFYDVIREYKDITFYYLKGNHDRRSKEEDRPENLKRFSSKWTSYPLSEDITLSGIERCKENCLSFYDTLSLEEDKRNLVRLHGALSDKAGRDSIYLKKLKNKNIDYLAIGHIHSYQDGRMDERGSYAYPGCLQGRGFDETGEKGFILLTVDDKKIKKEFVPFSHVVIHQEEVDITNRSSIPSIISKIKESVSFDPDDIYRIVLKGDVLEDADFKEEDIERELSGLARLVNVKNRTRIQFNQEKLERDFSLKGEFYRLVLEDSTLSDQEKQEIITLGLAALEKKELF